MIELQDFPPHKVTNLDATWSVCPCVCHPVFMETEIALWARFRVRNCPNRGTVPWEFEQSLVTGEKNEIVDPGGQLYGETKPGNCAKERAVGGLLRIVARCALLLHRKWMQWELQGESAWFVRGRDKNRIFNDLITKLHRDLRISVT